jgi:hypothetical protein
MTRRRALRRRVLFARIAAAAVLLAALAGCWSPEPPASGGTFRFAVFGDGPYYAHENGRARRVIDALNARPLEFVIHVGDIMWQRCTDEAYARRRELIERIRHPIVYTPGDNEWLDCVDIGFRADDPLERLASLRSTFFTPADRSLGEMPLVLDTHSSRFTSSAAATERDRFGGAPRATTKRSRAAPKPPSTGYGIASARRRPPALRRSS